VNEESSNSGHTPTSFVQANAVLTLSPFLGSRLFRSAGLTWLPADKSAFLHHATLLWGLR